MANRDQYNQRSGNGRNQRSNGPRVGSVRKNVPAAVRDDAPRGRGGHASFAPKGSYDNRGKRDFDRRDDRRFDDKPRYDKKPRYDDKPRYEGKGKRDFDRRDDRRFDDKPRYDKKPRFDDKPRFEGKGKRDFDRRDDRRFDDKPRYDKKPRFDDKPRFDKKPRFDDKPRFDKKPRFDDMPARPAFEEELTTSYDQWNDDDFIDQEAIYAGENGYDDAGFEDAGYEEESGFAAGSFGGDDFEEADFSALDRFDSDEEEPEEDGEASAENVIAGRNPIREALKAGRDIEKLLVVRGEKTGSAREIIAMARENRVVVQEVDRVRLDAIYPGHQGMIAFVSAARYSEMDDIFELAHSRNEDPFVIILDGITDPHNLGAIMRTAECCGAHGVIVPKRRGVGLTPAAVKAAAGAQEYVKVVRVVNLARTINELKEQGVWVYGADMEGENAFSTDFSGPAALVIGSEGNGVSEHVLSLCDRTVSLPMKGSISSLNASVAAGVLMYQVMCARSEK